MLKQVLFVSLMALGVSSLSAQDTKSQEEKAAKAELPSGESIMDKFIEATGGVDAHKKIKNTVARGTFDFVAMGIKADMTIYTSEPNLHLSEVEIPGMGKMLEGVDGKIAWGYSAMQGPTIKEGKEAEEALNNATFQDHDWRAKYSSAKTEGLETVEGEECYKVTVTPKAGNPRTHYYSKETCLLVRIDSTTETAMGVLSVETVNKDYREVDGVLVPFQIINSFAGQTMKMTLTEVKSNVDIPKSTFEPPEEVKALLK